MAPLVVGYPSYSCAIWVYALFQLDRKGVKTMGPELFAETNNINTGSGRSKGDLGSVL